MKLIPRTIFFCLIFGFWGNFLFSQTESELSEENSESAIHDTLCFRYNFYRGDTLIYKVTANDSLINNREKPLKKRRAEELQVVCEDVDKYGNFHLSYKIISGSQKEWKEESDTVERKNNLWIGKKINLVIDSLGTRVGARNSDSTMLATSLGGAFQPYLFFSLGESCKQISTSWLVQSKDTIAENSYPPAVIEQTSLMRAKEKFTEGIDTFGLITFVKTAKGLYGFETDEISVSMQNVMNIYGELVIDLNEQIPKTFFVTQEEKIHFLLEDDSKIPAWKYSSTVFELILLKRNKAEQIPVQKKNNTKKKY